MTIHSCRFGTFTLVTEDDRYAVSALLGGPNPASEAFFRETAPTGQELPENPLGRRDYILGRSVGGKPVMLLEIRENPLFMNGKATKGTLLRLLHLPPNPGRHLGLLEHGFIALSRFAADLGYAETVFTYVDAADKLLVRLMQSGASRMPKCKLTGDVLTRLFNTTLGQEHSPLPKGYTIEESAAKDCWRVASLMMARGLVWNYAPDMNEKNLTALVASGRGPGFEDILTLRHEEQIVGCVAVWDQRPNRTFVLNRYPEGFGSFPGLRNFLSGMFKTPKLPDQGQPLNMVRLPFFFMHPKHFHLADALLKTALHRAAQKGAPLAALSLADTNSLRRQISLPGLTVRHHVFSVIFNGTARSRHQTGLTPQPELALL